MEAAVAAASAAAAAARDAAAATLVAAEAAAMNAAMAAAIANEATAAAQEAAAVASAAALSAKEAALTASAAAVNAKEAAATASAVASDAKEAAAVAASAGEVAAAVAAAMHASKKRKFHLVDDDQDDPPRSAGIADNGDFIDAQGDPRGTGDAGDGDFIDDQNDQMGSGDVSDGGNDDFISRLSDAVLGSIISLLTTKEAARTQVISRRWHPIWRSAPLNLVADQELNSKDHPFVDLISKILSEHPGPTRRFSLCLSIGNCHGKIKGWLSSQALDKLRDFELIPGRRFDVRGKFHLMPSFVSRFAPTLRVAKFGGCRFTNFIVKLSLKFPCLKQLTLDRVTISEDALQSMLSGCSALESLEVMKSSGFGHLCISSQTLKSIGFCACPYWASVHENFRLREVIIEDAPCLERLLSLDPHVGPSTIRLILAPKLSILGMLSESIAELEFRTTVCQKMIDVGLTTKMHTVRVLVLGSTGPKLGAVVNSLKCFPCLERLYVIFPERMPIWNIWKYESSDRIECLELHLKEVVLKNYDGTISSCIYFTKFFVLNAKVLKEMKITLPYHRQYNWFANQHRLLQTKDRASQDARIQLKCGKRVYFTHNKHTHDLSMADPFDLPTSGCSKCSGSPF